MNGDPAEQMSADYGRVEKAIRFIETNFKSRPTLDQMAEQVHLSKYHFDRLFKRWAGISPMQFAQFLTLDYTKRRLAESRSVLDAALDAGLSGPGRLHDLFVTFEAMTPGDFKRRGAGATIRYGFCPSPFGECLLAATRRGICYFAFVDHGGRNEAFRQLQQTWPGADLAERQPEACRVVARLFPIDRQRTTRPFHLLIKGTNFQINVWRALLEIPSGCMLGYRDVAVYLGRPAAVRAVASAVAINPVAYLIPCHRVIASSGRIHRYRWGAVRKQALLGWEAARRALTADAS